ncbi:hypothetical protein BDV93DRAFT_172834 [Ceratobasidium sp. AG-I]|nr:hypothetical protein BDV93DRAFT_172834 [Ceratobasidium sp. AG-I]
MLAPVTASGKYVRAVLCKCVMVKLFAQWIIVILGKLGGLLTLGNHTYFRMSFAPKTNLWFKSNLYAYGKIRLDSTMYANMKGGE